MPRHRRRSRIPALLRLLAAAMALVVVAGGAWFGYQKLTGVSCSGEIPLAVAAAPAIAPAIEQTARDWADGGAEIDGVCVRVTVTAAEPVEVAAAVATRQGANLTGVGQASGATQVPDVWLPDSSTWALRLRSAATGLVPETFTSVARSPVVIAAPEPVARQLGWPDRAVGYTDLLKALTTSTDLHPGIVDPVRDAAGLSGLIALAGAAGGGDSGQEATAAILRNLAVGSSTVAEDLLNKFPNAADAATVAGALSAAPLSERDVIAYNAAQRPVPLAALYLNPEPPPLDYPYLVLPGLDASRIAAAAGLLDQLRGGAYRDRLAAQGLRGADGVGGAGFDPPQGAPTDATPTPATSASAGAGAAGGLDATSVERALTTWTTVTAPGRLLAVLDVSGSMKQTVPTAGGATRMKVTVEAAGRGLSLFDDSWAVGLWVFSTNLQGSQDWRQLVPIGPVATQRGKLQTALAGVDASSGNTGLYDTALAAYKAVQNGYDPSRPNSVVIMTDGQNQDANGISLKDLVGQLNTLAQGKKPVKIIIVGIGDEVSKSELEQITEPTGGGVFIAKDPSTIGDIFIQAIALLRR